MYRSNEHDFFTGERENSTGVLRISRPSSPQASHHAQGGDIADLYNVAYIESHLK